MNSIYLDNAASTRVHPDVLDAMMPFLSEQYGNPSSIHSSGRRAKKAVGRARRQVASLIRAEDPSEIFFTSGGTESNNAAIRGVARAALASERKCRIITSPVEHDAVLEPCRDLEAAGLASLEYLPVDGRGTVDASALEDLLAESDGDGVGCARDMNTEGAFDEFAQLESTTSGADARPRQQRQQQESIAHDRGDGAHVTLVSVMYANNEVGTIQPMERIAQICSRHGAILHTDAVQAAGKIPLDVAGLGADLVSISSHKIHGPKGVGALYVRSSIRHAVSALMHGGGQEDGMRSGTENVAGIVGFGVACEIAVNGLDQSMRYTADLRDALVQKVLDEIPESTENGEHAARLPGNAHFTFLGVNGEDLLIKLDEHGIAASTGSACSVNSQKASHVLRAMGFSHEQITGSLRLTLDASNTHEEVGRTADVLRNVIRELRAVSPFKPKYSFRHDGKEPRRV